MCPVCFWEDDGVQFRWLSATTRTSAPATSRAAGSSARRTRTTPPPLVGPRPASPRSSRTWPTTPR
ncbi:CPCC family cysteine-rich protein [Streptomyces sp. NPDC047821]|uniref:CPCC family cysteine-rich protein n=1 Tax=Streptomyces sp. NPDC047821 TaxID=3365488 RepID=UPI00371B8EB9